jgi:hypothetical protein
MNRGAAEELRDVLSFRNPDAEITVTHQEDGANVTLSSSEIGDGGSGPHVEANAYFSIGEGDGALVRFLVQGHL